MTLLLIAHSIRQHAKRLRSRERERERERWDRGSCPVDGETVLPIAIHLVGPLYIFTGLLVVAIVFCGGKTTSSDGGGTSVL